MFVSMRATFLEKEYLIGSAKANVELNEVRQEEVPLYSETTIELALIGSDPEPIEEPLRRSSRVPHQLDRYFNFLVHDGIPLSSIRTMRTQSPIWMHCRGPTLRNG